MKRFALFLSALVLLMWGLGFFLRHSENPWLSKIFPLGWLIFTFLWIPFFLIYAYDRKQRRKEQADQENGQEG
ncbi:MAG: hypothetical protein LPK80_06810 [Bacteroidota bacterium]|nr:hypothetical protein [Bacteroidota bacterium]